MDSTEGERMSVVVSTHMDRRITGTSKEVDIKRKVYVLQEHVLRDPLFSVFNAGSAGEGLDLPGSDFDQMVIIEMVTVMYPGQYIPRNLAHHTILYIREADSRPGYVQLQVHVGREGRKCHHALFESLVLVGDSLFVSSDIFREVYVRTCNDLTTLAWKSNGPSCSADKHIFSPDIVPSLPCKCWPKEANEWITRTRHYGWPHQALIDKIVKSGCQLVPVGDKCSEDTFLQWRISFATSERSLVHSFSHIQFKVYALLKFVLKQIKVALRETIGDDDVLCSYFLKTILFHAIETSSHLFWQEKHLLYCFRFCLNMLIAWVRAGVCPNYFIPANNLFQRKVHGQNQAVLLDILNNHWQMKWPYLLADKLIGFKDYPSIWKSERPLTEQEITFWQDQATCKALWVTVMLPGEHRRTINKAIQLLSKTQSDSVDEVLAFHYIVISLQRLVQEQFSQDQFAMNNKTRYKGLRKCKNGMIPGAAMGTDLLYLATFHFLTGNCIESLKMCKQVMKLARYFTTVDKGQEKIEDMLRFGYHPSDDTLTRLRKIHSQYIALAPRDLYLPHLFLEMTNEKGYMYIPPLSYAVFLTFLCCHELGDTRGQNEALHKMEEVQYEEKQRGRLFGIVHTLLGICYEILGDARRAIGAYWKSFQSICLNSFISTNPALKRIAIVYLCMYATQKFN